MKNNKILTGKKSKKLLDKKPDKNKILIILGCIFIVSFFIYSNSFQNEILYGWDDGEYVSDKSVQNFKVAEFFSNYYLGMYQPIAAFSFAINYQLSGLNPAAYHFTNFLLHLINISLVFFLIFKISKRLEISAFVAFLFAIHPMHTEAISWMSTRSNLLFFMFYLSALISYVNYLKDNRNIKHLLLCFGFFVLSLFSKSIAITLPIMLFVFDFYLSRKFSKKLIFEKIPFFILSIIFGLVAIFAAKSYGHITYLETDYSAFDRIFLICYAIVFYVVKLIIPINLSAIYSFPLKENGSLPWEYYGAFLLVILAIWLIYKFRKNKDLIFGTGFFLIAISVVLPLFWSRFFIVSERYSYLAYIGLYFILGSILQNFLSIKKKIIKPIIYSILIVFIIFFAITTVQRNKVWKNPDILMTDVISKNENGMNAAYAYFFRGNYKDQKQDYNNALKDYNEAIRNYPEYIIAYNNRGIVRGIMQDFEGAYNDFNKCINLNKTYADPYYNRGILKYMQKDLKGACQDWKKASVLGYKQANEIIRQYCK
jgi:protein O-mannosyl-transferase